MLAHAIAGVSDLLRFVIQFRGVTAKGGKEADGCWLKELGVPFINISAPSVVSGMSGESEKTLRDTFDEAKKAAPCLLFIDEIDAITPKRESAQREMERRIVAQFLTCMDGESPAQCMSSVYSWSSRHVMGKERQQTCHCYWGDESTGLS